MWWHRQFPAPGRWRRGIQGFKISLGYIPSLELAWATGNKQTKLGEKTTSLPNKNKTNQKLD